MKPDIVKKILIMSFFLYTGSAYAANTDTYFDDATGVLIIPHLVLGGQVYYLTLSLEDAASFTFRLNIDSIAEITPTGSGSAVSADAIVGTWTDNNNNDVSTVLEFRSDGSYTLDATLHIKDPSCSTGREEGNYSWEPSTGMLVTSVTSDTNLECGLSHPASGGSRGGAFRFVVDGNTLNISEPGSSETATLSR